MTNLGYILRASSIAAIGGLLFGYDTAVIAGTVEYLQIHFELSDIMLGWTVSSALLGCMLGAAGAGWLSDVLGRKVTLLICALLFFISAVWSGLAQGGGELALARILGGLGVGAASLLTPVYISEIAPTRMRGALTTLNQIAILLGMIVVFFVNAQLAHIGEEAWRISHAWRWMFASEAIPAVLFLALLFFIPESPRWLVLKGKKDRAREILRRIGGERSVDRQIVEIEASFQGERASWGQLFASPYRKLLLIGSVLAILQQATGINIVMYYAPRIFTSVGLDTSSAIGHSVIIGLVMLVFTVVALLFADRLGRRPLLLFSCAGMTLSLAVLGWVFGAGDSGNATFILLWILLYVASFSIGMGPLGWTVIAEIFPNKARGRAVGLCVLLLWLANFAVSQFFPFLLTTFGSRSFWIYGVFGLVAFIFIQRILPETSGKSLEEIN